ncbi:MAG: hypothetical protein EOP48_05755 [Sphingobacteriales bacterium]|nr:MAG: hypothetical protein EOP48_05755 [Sphingobacteriales bacterium]
MVNNINWGSYWSVLIPLTLIYYAYVLLIYYGSDIRNLLAGKSSILTSRNSQQAAPITESPIRDENNGDQLFPAVQSLTDEMNAFMDQAGHDSKDVIIPGLQRIFQKYKRVSETPYQEAIENLLIIECETKCAIRLNEAEVRKIWMG